MTVLKAYHTFVLSDVPKLATYLIGLIWGNSICFTVNCLHKIINRVSQACVTFPSVANLNHSISDGAIMTETSTMVINITVTEVGQRTDVKITNELWVPIKFFSENIDRGITALHIIKKAGILLFGTELQSLVFWRSGIDNIMCDAVKHV